MFYKCSKLQKIDLSNFNTNNITNLSYVFCECSSLKELNIELNTNKAKNMIYMFSLCPNELIIKIKNLYKNITLDAFAW